MEAGASSPPGAVLAAAAEIGRRTAAWERPECGLSAADRYAVTSTDGSRFFVKAATDDQTSAWLRAEHHALDAVGPAFCPRIIAWRDGPRPLLVTEFLDGYWPAGSGVTEWRPGDIAAVFAALERLRNLPVPPTMTTPVAWPAPKWSRLVNGSALVEAGLCTPRWLDRHGAALVAADDGARQSTDAVVHGDVRSDNLCVGADGAVRFVDWSDAGTGHPLHDLAGLLPTVHLEGGPAPWEVLREPVGLIVRLAGPTVARALDDAVQPAWLRGVLRRLAGITLRWLAETLVVEPPLDN